MGSPVEMWCVLVPLNNNDGEVFPIEKHHEWDKFIADNCGGLTLLPSLVGKFGVDKDIIEDKVKPVMVACTRAQIIGVLDYTRRFYDQKGVLAYKISDDVLIR